jgi:heme/copper-type cytochrome/quinol oxidase subunit 3
VTDYADTRVEGIEPRTTAAGSRAVADAVALRRGRPVAWWGMLMLIASESTLFGCLIGTYFYFRFEAQSWPPPGIPAPSLATPIVLALVLAASALPLRLATRAARAARVAGAWSLILVALLVQAGYLAYAIHDFRDHLQTFTPQTNAYGSIYYVLLGADHAHVVVGLLLSAWLLLKLSRGSTTYRLNALDAIALYWYAVIALTLVVTATILSARV